MDGRLKSKGEVTDREIREAVEEAHLEARGTGGINQSLIGVEDELAQRYIRKRIVPTLGRVPKPKADGVWRWICANVNGLATSKSANLKAERTQELIREYDADGLALCEIGVDPRQFKASQSIASILGMQEPHRSITATNRYQNKLGKKLQGGCAVAAAGEICQYVKATTGGNDPRQLGRWSSLILQSHPDHRTRIVSAYNVGKGNTKLLGSVYQQQLRYIQTNNLRISPQKLMREDFLSQLQQWLRQGDRILLYMDANEHVVSGPLCSGLARLGFTPNGHRLLGSLPNTHVEGRECIDEVWSSFGLEVTAIQVQSFHQSIGDHRSFLVDFTTRAQLSAFSRD